MVFLARRLEKDVKLVLDDICSDPAKKMALITGRQVELAEELSKILLIIIVTSFQRIVT